MNYWIFPCNTKYFDIIEHFKTKNEVVFKRDGMIRKGDIAYIYLANPFKQIKFKCEVVEPKLTIDCLEEHQYAISSSFYNKGYVKLKYLSEINSSDLNFNNLKDNGLGQVQRQSRLDGKLLTYIQSKEIEENK